MFPSVPWCESFPWNLLNLFNVTSLKEMNSPSTSGHQLIKAPQLRFGLHTHFPTSMLGFFQLCPCMDHVHIVTIAAISYEQLPSCLESSVSLCSPNFPCLSQPIFPSSTMAPELWMAEVDDTGVWFRDTHFAVSYSLHFGQLWFSGLTSSVPWGSFSGESLEVYWCAFCPLFFVPWDRHRSCPVIVSLSDVHLTDTYSLFGQLKKFVIISIFCKKSFIHEWWVVNLFINMIICI